jgi:hypothetical protein
MIRFLRLAEHERTQRRTVADALTVFRSMPAFTNDARVDVVVTPFHLPSGNTVSLIDLRLCDGEEFAFIVSLPSSTTFRAHRKGSREIDIFDISLLHRATADAYANVRLGDGTILRGVEVIPERLPYDPSDLDYRIVYSLILMCDAVDRCIPRWRDKASPDIRAMIPAHLRMLDCQAVSQLEAPPLKVLAAFMADHDPILKSPSLQKIADALNTFGIRPTVARPRKRPHHHPAAI